MHDAPARLPTLDQARRYYAEQVLADLSAVSAAALEAAQVLNEQPAERALAQQRQDMLQQLMRHSVQWVPALEAAVRELLGSVSPPSTASAPLLTGFPATGELQLVDDETIQRNIFVSRLTLAILDKATWEFADLRARLGQLEPQGELEEGDLFRPQALARCVLRTWMQAGLALTAWRELESPLQRFFAVRVETALHETNRWLIERGVLPQVDLRPFIRRAEGAVTQAGALAPEPPAEPAEEVSAPADQISTRSPAPALPERDWGATPMGPNLGRAVPNSLGGPASAGRVESPPRQLSVRPGSTSGSAGQAGARGAAAAQGGGGGGGGFGGASGGAGGGGHGASGAAALGPGLNGGTRFAGPGSVFGGGGGGSGSGGAEGDSSGRGDLDEETRLMTRQSAGSAVQGDVVMARFSDILAQHVPGFNQPGSGRAPSEQLSQAMHQAQQRAVSQAEAALPAGTGAPPSPARMVAELREQQQALKQAATTPEERATVELVALLFQSILTDERVPAALRVWFARLQMPVLRVALAEPDFFSGAEHPARRLIDRMGACVMGFEADAEVIGAPLEAEIRRIVQVVEAFPDTGKRVFQAVLGEFEKFLERYLREHTEAARVGVSLAQQIEQRETLAIQYTIELRGMINELPVQESVRDFLFHIWADVLATTAVRHGAQSAAVNEVRDAAAELLWAASAKTTREERADVIRRMPPLLGILRQGMGAAGLEARRQEEAIKALNGAFTAAFSARATSISPDLLEQLKQRLSAIEELLPEEGLELDDTWVLDEAHHQNEGLEVVADGGSMPGPAMLAAAGELDLGSAFTLEYRGRHDLVRLTWQGLHRQLTLFTTQHGRCVLFQKTRLAAFLQAGLLLPLEDESLTTKATRDAMRKISADPSRLKV
ncbi:DUF1631 family protein [Ideonella sp.]|uniref:DUF1631 family protein n=1 Tax=Ideonella sp. TaxID=1929293 RepID=UPI003BB68808